MQSVSSHPQLRLLRDLCRGRLDHPARTFATGLAALDNLLPAGGFARGAVHELLSDPAVGPPPLLLGLLLARALDGPVAWSDPRREFYPPAAAALGLPIERLLLLRPATP